MQGMPTAGEQHKKLTAAMAGDWSGDEKILPSPWDPQGGTAKGRFRVRVDLDGFCAIGDYTQERGGQIAYRGHGVYSWDPTESSYTMHWFDSMGGLPTPLARGKWNGNVLTFASSGPMGHGRYTYTFVSPTQTDFRLEHSEDGKNWATFLDATYRKSA